VLVGNSLDPGLMGLSADVPESTRRRRKSVSVDQAYSAKVRERLLRRRKHQRRQVAVSNFHESSESSASGGRHRKTFYTIEDIWFEAYDS
jgi:hypothetical protein